jgi:hypothetical protein
VPSDRADRHVLNTQRPADAGRFFNYLNLLSPTSYF